MKKIIIVTLTVFCTPAAAYDRQAYDHDTAQCSYEATKTLMAAPIPPLREGETEKDRHARRFSGLTSLCLQAKGWPAHMAPVILKWPTK